MNEKSIFPCIVCSLLVSAASWAATDESSVCVREDPAGDLNTAAETDPGFDLRKVTIERKGSNKLQIEFEMEGTIPKNPKKEISILLFMDTDNNPETGPRYGEMAPDLNVVVFKTQRAMQWEAKVDKVSMATESENFTVQKLDLRGKTATVVIASPMFKQPADFTFFAEVIQDGQSIVDRLPDDLFLKTRFTATAK